MPLKLVDFVWVVGGLLCFWGEFAASFLFRGDDFENAGEGLVFPGRREIVDGGGGGQVLRSLPVDG